jgi:hypothetical protein
MTSKSTAKARRTQSLRKERRVPDEAHPDFDSTLRPSRLCAFAVAGMLLRRLSRFQWDNAAFSRIVILDGDSVVSRSHDFGAQESRRNDGLNRRGD